MVKTVFKKETETEPQRVDDFPPVKMLLDKRREITFELGRVEGEIEKLRRESSVDKHAREFLRGQPIKDKDNDLDTIHNQRRVLRQSLQILDNDLMNAKQSAARQLARQFEPEYKGLTKRTAAAAKELKDCLLAERIFSERARLSGLADYPERPAAQKFLGGHGQEDHPNFGLLNKLI